MFAIEVTMTFSAAHALRLPGGVVEPLHGHDFKVTARISAEALDAAETVVDFHAVEAELEGIVSPWRNRNLNEVFPFNAAVNPSAERIAEQVGRALGHALTAQVGGASAAGGAGEEGRGVRVEEVRVTEAPGCLAIWRAE